MKATFLCIIPVLLLATVCFARSFQEPLVIDSGWQMQPVAQIASAGGDIAQTNFNSDGWYSATVPGTVLMTLVNNKVYSNPLFGENNRPDIIPDSLCRTSWWFRTTFTVPKDYVEKKTWLNFEGINYSAEVWLNGQKVGVIRGAFIRGTFDITTVVTPGKEAALAVLITPQPHPGMPHEHTIANGMGRNGGISAQDGATFLCTIGWDWMPVIRDRNGPPGRLAMLNLNYVRMKFLPHINPGDAVGYAESRLTSSSGGAVQMATDIPARIVLLAKTGDNVKASVKTTIQMAVKRPNSSGYIADILEV